MAAGHILLTGVIHMPFLPARVAAQPLEQPSLDLGLLVRTTAISLRVIPTR
ncbi:MAG: hypothetical protein HYY95_08480 [Candidatus Rokubacteria bacterium]|nr:hypothetical protein [Candidatus Rokubacteria bacterium]